VQIVLGMERVNADWCCAYHCCLQVLGVPADAAASVRKAVQAIIDWLEEASSEEDSEEESDE
jgi:hypothetical protein